MKIGKGDAFLILAQQTEVQVKPPEVFEPRCTNGRGVSKMCCKAGGESAKRNSIYRHSSTAKRKEDRRNATYVICPPTQLAS